MDISGSHDLNAGTQKVWDSIMDPRVLEKITPGIKTLEVLGPDEYDALSEIKMGPVKGAFKGNLKITDKIEGKSCKVILDQKSKMGNAVAEISMEIMDKGDNSSEIKYQGSAKLSGTLARMGQRIVGGVVKALAKQFFSALEEELNQS